MTTSDANAQEPTRWHRRPRVRRLLGSLLSPSKFAIVGILGIVVNQVALYVLYRRASSPATCPAVLVLAGLDAQQLRPDRAVGLPRPRDRGSVLWRYLIFNALNLATLLVRLPGAVRPDRARGVHYLVVELGGDRADVRDPLPRRRQLDLGRSRPARAGAASTAATSTTSTAWSGSPRPSTCRSSPRSTSTQRGRAGHRRSAAAASAAGRASAWPRPAPTASSATASTSASLSAAFDVAGRRADRARRELAAQRGRTTSCTRTWSSRCSGSCSSTRGHVLLHCAAIDAERGAVDHVGRDRHRQDEHGPAPAHAAHDWGFISDDMAILTPAARSCSYPKPMTLSLAHDGRGQRPGAAAGRPVHAGDPQPGPLEGGPLGGPRPRPAATCRS